MIGGAVSNGGITLRWAGETFAPIWLPKVTPTPTSSNSQLPPLPVATACSCCRMCSASVHHCGTLISLAPIWEYARTTPEVTSFEQQLKASASSSPPSFTPWTPYRACSRFAAIGGPFRSDLWRQVMASTLGRPMSVEADAGGTALGAAALGWYALGGASSLTDALAAVGGPRLDVSAATVAVTPLAVATYAKLRASVRALIDGYEEVAAMFASVDPLNSSTSPGQQEWPDSS